MPPITRIAPTPSGFLHKGNLLNFMLVDVWAKQNQAQVLLRIDDLDAARFRKEYLEDIFNWLEALEISWQLGPKNAMEFYKDFSQSNRVPLYKKTLLQLIESRRLYACLCSRTQLIEKGHSEECLKKVKATEVMDETPLRFELQGQEETIKDFYGKMMEAYPIHSIGDPLVIRRDGIPAYALASLTDDLHFGVTHIIRGADLLSSTLTQVQMGRALNNAFPETLFLHHSLERNALGEKLSKSAGTEAQSLLGKLTPNQVKALGFELRQKAEAIINRA